MKSYEELARYKKNAFVLGAVGIIAVVFAAWYSLHESTKMFFEIRGKSLNQITTSLARQIDADEHSLIRSPSDMSSKHYESVTKILEDCQRDYPEVVSAYTMRLADGKASLVVSPPADYDRNGKLDGDMEKRDQVGTPYFHESTAAMLKAAGGTPGFDTEFTYDQWGSWLTACSPLKNFTGGIEGIVCVDESATDVIAGLKKQRLLTGALALIVVIVFSGLLIEYITAKIELNTNMMANGQRESVLKRAITAIEETKIIALCCFDLGGTIRVWDRASESIFGITSKEAIGSDIFSVLSRVVDVQNAKDDLKTAMQSKKTSPAREINFTNVKGEPRKLLSVMSPSIERGDVVEMIYVGIDVTQRMA